MNISVFLAQAAAPIGPVPIGLRDVITFGISVASFCFAVAAFFRSSFEQRRKLILDVLVAEIVALEQISLNLVAQVEAILVSCTHSGLTPAAAFIQTQCEFRKAELHLANIEHALGAEGDKVHRQYIEWHRELTSDRYPIQDPAHAYDISDDRYIRVATAQGKWRGYLFQLKLRCLRYQLKFW